MKRIIIVLLSITIIVASAVLAIIYKSAFNDAKWNGFLRLNGTKLVNQFNQEVILKGLSSHGIQWEDEKILSKENLQILKDEWNINTFRIAMYTADGGYIEHSGDMEEKVYKIVDDCIDLNLYAIIDWHTLSDNYPNTYKKEAIDYFDRVSAKYANNPNVIYEICNEPNGDDVTWDKDIYPYADEVIKVIRKNAPKSLIIVGTAKWCTELLSPTQKKLPYDNILYSYHFYAGTHKDYARQDIETALKKGLPVIISEWGTTTVANGEEVYLDEAQKWIEFLDEKHIGYINWSFSNIDEATSILKPNATTLEDKNLTKSGKFIKNSMNKDG